MIDRLLYTFYDITYFGTIMIFKDYFGANIYMQLIDEPLPQICA